MTYAYDALARAAGDLELGLRFWVDLAVVLGATVLALVLGAATLRRRGVGGYPFALTAPINFTTDSLASPNSICVFGST